jgi:sugar/nucleoside kinase (ribokinase family)
MKGILEKLLAREGRISEKKLIAGFDGFIDTIAKPIRRSGKGREGLEYFQTIPEFGTYIAGQGHKSASIELEIVERRMGGNMPNFARAAAALGLRPQCIGMLSDVRGEPGTNAPVFRDLPGQAFSFAPAGTATALEFDDGKIFLAPRYVLPAPPQIEGLGELIRGADGIACVNWGELSFSTALWKGLRETAAMFPPARNALFLFDLYDFNRRTDEEIAEVLTLIASFSSAAVSSGGEPSLTAIRSAEGSDAAGAAAVLSLNRNEALLLGERIIGETAGLEAVARSLGQRYSIDEIIIHSHDGALVCAGNEICRVEAVPQAKPAISTGAGDTFNAAYIFARLMGLETEEVLRFANFYAGMYVSLGSRPGLRDLIPFA